MVEGDRQKRTIARGPAAIGLPELQRRCDVLSASAELPAVHRVASLLKRWWPGTRQGSISAEHLGYYR